MKPPWSPGLKRFLTDRDRDIAESDAAELARNEAEYEAFLNRRPTLVEGYDERDDAFDPSDPGDLLEREGGVL